MKKIKLLIIPVIALILCGCSNDKEIDEMERLIKICKENGGIPNTRVKDNWNSYIPVVECKWKEEICNE